MFNFRSDVCVASLKSKQVEYFDNRVLERGLDSWCRFKILIQ